MADAEAARSRLVLASASPRRQALLERAGIEFETRPANIPEERRDAEPATAFVERLAREKALAVVAALGAAAAATRFVLGADTVVVLGDDVLGKPRDAAHAVELLGRLVGREHRVVTGVALAGPGGRDVRTLAVSSRVRMRPAPRDEIARYVESGEPLDKAGAYALQGEGRRFVVGVEGSETNVIGLPLEETLALLRDCGAIP